MLPHMAGSMSYAQDLVVINEVLSSNTNGEYDPDFGAFSDWIELHNPGNQSANLQGWMLSDDPADPGKWTFPENTVIPAGGYLLLWADGHGLIPGEVTTVEFTEIHTITAEAYHLNFRINRDGEVLLLKDPDGVTKDSISLPEQERDISYGRNPANTDQWVYFGDSTPGEANGEEFAEEVVYAGTPVFSADGGFHTSGLSLSLDAGGNGTIRYTTDGSIPHAGSPAYEAPLTLWFSQVIKARIFQEGKLPGEVVTRSFFIDKETTLPVLAISTNHENLWGFDFGLYQNNYKNREIFSHLEYYDEEGNSGFRANAGLQLFGSQIFLFDQKPFSIFFRGRYGQDSVHYPFFGGKDVSTFESLVLRNGGNDNNLAFFRDGLGAALVENQVDLDYQAYRPVVVYMNGEYWGIFNIREKLNEEYLEGNHGLNPDYVDILEDSLSVNNGDENAYRNLLSYVEQNDLSDPAHYRYVGEKVDLDAFMNYMSLKLYGAYQQWQVNNKYWKGRTPGEQWRWIAFDLEHCYGGPGSESVDSDPFVQALDPEDPKTAWYTLLFRKLMENDDFRAELLQRMALHLQTAFSEERVTGIIDSLQAELLEEMDDHILRWGSPVSMTFWQQQVQGLRGFAEQRNGYLFDHIMNHFNLEGMSELSVVKEGGGTVQIASAYLPETDSVTFSFFHQLPVQLKAMPAPGYVFAGWNGQMMEAEIDVLLTRDTIFRAVFVEDMAYVLPDTIVDSLHITDEGQPWVAAGNIIIPEGSTLVIGEGVNLEIVTGASIVNRGQLIVEGASGNPVRMIPHTNQASGSFIERDNTWGGIIIESGEATSLQHLHLEGASSGLGYGDYKGAISAVNSLQVDLKGIRIDEVADPIYAYNSEISIDSCILSSNATGDLINLVACADPVIRHCTLKGNFFEDTDAIDLDRVTNAIVEENFIYSFFGFNSDGIDLGEGSSGILIRNNRIMSISDKGISVGQGSEIEARGNIIVDCNQGFGIKDFDSYAWINQNTLFANRTGVAVFEKNVGNGGGSARVENTIIAGSLLASIWVDEYSAATISYSLSDTDTLQGYNNLFDDPQFLGESSFDFFLASGSPCIDGGLPNQQDPDGTRADIGAYHTGSMEADTSLLITEINYRSHRAFNTGDWLEFYNPSFESVDLSGYIIKGGNYADEYVMRDFLQIAPGEYMVFAENRDSMILYYREGSGDRKSSMVSGKDRVQAASPTIKGIRPSMLANGSPVEGNLSFGLGMDGELIRLYDADYRLVHAVRYGSDHPWPEGANGKGATLELSDVDGNNPHVSNWQSSFVAGGTPGEANSTMELPDGIFINEWMAKNDDAFPDPFGEYDDWFEVYNENSFQVDLAGMYVVIDEDETNPVMIPYFHGDSTVAGAGDFVYFWADRDPEQGGLHLDLRLPAGGSILGIGYMLNGELHYADHITYGPSQADVAYGRYPDGSDFISPMAMTPGSSNTIVGIQPPENPETAFRIYPNPARGFFYVEWAVSEGFTGQSPGQCIVYNSAGQQLMEQEVSPGIPARLDVGHLPSGFYIVRLKNTRLFEKLVVE